MMVGIDRLKFILNRIRERLWFKPLLTSLVSIVLIAIALGADYILLQDFVLNISQESIEALLSIMASSMLAIATFAVASMVTAYASASSTATPRSVKLVITDDLSQNALSIFISAFIFSIIALTAMKNNIFQVAGLLVLFIFTISVFGLVVITFVRWVDSIARLGRVGTTIDMVEKATAKAFLSRRKNPTLGGVKLQHTLPCGQPVFASTVGYVQYIDIESLQSFATKANCRVVIAVLPGAFVSPERPIAYILNKKKFVDSSSVTQAFTTGGERTFDDDPRFGLVVLSEIAGRALSPAINDPGTAIDIIGTIVRIFTLWLKDEGNGEPSEPVYDRVEVPEISVSDLFDDAFTAIARDGAGTIEVVIRLQKALHSLASLGDTDVQKATIHHARMALARSEKALTLPEEIATIRELARFAAK